MKRSLIALGCLWAAAPVLAPGPAAAAGAQSRRPSATARENVASVRRDLQNRYVRFIQAYLNRDTDAARDILTPDFRGGRPGARRAETVNREQVIRALQGTFGGAGVVRRSRVQIERLRLRNNGRTALATTRHEFAGRVTDPRDGKTRDMDARLRYQDTWVRTEDGWKLRRSVPLLQRVLVDGRPIPTGGTRRSAARSRSGRSR